MKVLITIAVMIALIGFSMIVASLSSGSKDAHDGYEKWKERHKHGKMD